MIPARRDHFNRGFTELRYREFLAAIDARAGVHVEFRVSETPCFFPAALVDRLSSTAVSLIEQLLSNRDYMAAADAAVPPAFRLPQREAVPTFVQVDFGLVRVDGEIEGRLVEMQAFPSLYAFQFAAAAVYTEHWQLDGLTPFIGDLTADDYLACCRRAMLGDHDPGDVVLIEIDPRRQKTLPDFALTERLWGIRAVDVRDVVREGRGLIDTTGGRRRPIARVYNRVIPDDLARSGASIAFDYRDDLDIEWAGGPDWFFRISKFSLPWLRHPWVPETHFLDDAPALSDDRDDWILKPLFSFAGGGIVFAPTDADIAAIPAEARRHFVLQRRVAFTPVIATPAGPTQAEVRIMLVHDDGRYRPLIPLIRMGRGRMMGVDHNKGLAWVGASAALMEKL
jgi:hypothetical protein